MPFSEQTLLSKDKSEGECVPTHNEASAPIEVICPSVESITLYILDGISFAICA